MNDVDAQIHQLRLKGEIAMLLEIKKGEKREIRRKDIEEQYYMCKKCREIVLWKLDQSYVPNYTSLLWYRDEKGHRIKLG